jgi:hypothetical protein
VRCCSLLTTACACPDLLPLLPRTPHPAPLQAFDQYLREATQRLGRRIDDLDDVKAVVAALREVREYEAGVDAVVGPIEDMYALLAR